MITPASPLPRSDAAGSLTRAAPTVGWVLRRALFGLALVVVVSAVAAWLTAAGLDPSQLLESE